MNEKFKNVKFGELNKIREINNNKLFYSFEHKKNKDMNNIDKNLSISCDINNKNISNYLKSNFFEFGGKIYNNSNFENNLNSIENKEKNLNIN